MSLARNITSIIVNLSLIIYYASYRVYISFEESIISPLLSIKSREEPLLKDNNDYIDAYDPHSYRVEEDETEWNRERNRYGFPREIKRRS